MVHNLKHFLFTDIVAQNLRTISNIDDY